jgi:hypothetical protein
MPMHPPLPGPLQLQYAPAIPLTPIGTDVVWIESRALSPPVIMTICVVIPAWRSFLAEDVSFAVLGGRR